MPVLPRQRARTKRYDAGASAHTFSSPKEMFRSVYFNIIDETHGAIQERISGKGFEILLKVESVVDNGLKGQC